MGWSRLASRSASVPTSCCTTPRRPGRCARTPSARGRPTPGCSGRRFAAASRRRSRTGASCSRSRWSGRREGCVNGFLALEDGTVYHGESVGAEGFACGEAVFTTAMTGYQEVVTDPSYAEQLVSFTAPMVGNYGVARARSESRRAHAGAVLMREARGPRWTDWLRDRGVVALSGVDTRSLVLRLREGGALRAVAVAGDGSVDEAVEAARRLPSMEGRALVALVST